MKTMLGMAATVAALTMMLVAPRLMAGEPVATAKSTEGDFFVVILEPKKANLPFDVAAEHGAALIHRSGLRVVARVPEEAVEGLRHNPKVRYIQRMVLGKPSRPPSGNSLTGGIQETSQARSMPRVVGAGTQMPVVLGPYSYDDSQNIRAIGEDVYRYDTIGRLGEAKVNLGATLSEQSYQYDRYGNLTQTITNGTQLALPADAATNRLSATLGVQYDAVGNLTQTATESYRYDQLGMINGPNVFSVYAATDERIGQILVQDGSSWRWTLRDLGNRVVREYASFGPGPGDQYFYWDSDHYYAGSTLVSAEREAAEGGERNFHVDHLGTARIVTDGNGTTMSEHKYLPFGAELTSIMQDRSKGYDHEEPNRFTGHERDGLETYNAEHSHYVDYMHARYYVPQWGRFLSVDPMLDVEKATREPQNWNRYSYVTNNPMKFTDPDGREKTIYFLGGLNHQITAYDEIDTIRGFVESQSGYSLNLRSQMSRSEVLGSLRNLDSTDIAVVNAHSWDLNLQTERGATGRETFTASNIVSAFNRGGNPQALILAGCRSQDIARTVANQTGVVTFGTTARATSREVGFAATVLATIYAKTGNAAQAVKVANSILQKGACPKSDPGCSAPRPEFVYFEPEKKK